MRQPSSPRPTPGRGPSTEPVDFDEFYLAVRRRLMLQCLALTGDLSASRSAVRDAFVAAWQHWRKVSRLDNPEEWVRPRAWSIAQRRSVARIWHREKGLSEQQSAVLDALSNLPDAQRKVLLLAHLASLPLLGIGRELGLTQTVVEEYLQTATTAVALDLDCDSAVIRGQLESLAPLVTSPGLPRVTVVRRSGLKRRRWHAVRGSAVLVVLALVCGWFVSAGSAERLQRKILEHPVTASMLIDVADVEAVEPAGRWTVQSTGNNTAGDGINTICQRSRFADERGIGAWVRELRATGRPPRHIVQTVEVSASPRAASAAYATTLGWYAGCTQARVQLVRAYEIDNLGDRAQALRLRLPGARDQHYAVVVARSGAVTTTTVQRTVGSREDPLKPVLGVVSAGMKKLCATSAITDCEAGPPTVRPVLPPPSGETKGMLATADLPPVARIDKPWVGTDPVSGGRNLAATPCDRTTFDAAGEVRSRTFLIPQARLPERFGLTETYGRLGSVREAKKFITKVRRRMARCEKDQLGTEVSHHVDRLKGVQGSSWSIWRQTAEINDERATVSYWMGIARAGRYVGQVTLTPSGRYDVTQRVFADLVARARDRLLELPE